MMYRIPLGGGDSSVPGQKKVGKCWGTRFSHWIRRLGKVAVMVILQPSDARAYNRNPPAIRLPGSQGQLQLAQICQDAVKGKVSPSREFQPKDGVNCYIFLKIVL